jgi:hypothetical protein
MSRSRKQTPIGGITTAKSEKEDKRFANRKARRVVREVLCAAPEAEVLPHLREVSDTWTMSKDAKVYYGHSPNAAKYSRK